MNQLFTCDDVFDRLTSGPIQIGDPDADAVDSHLAACHECRALAEALRPAVDLIHESLAVDSCRERPLPAYQGRIPAYPEPLEMPAQSSLRPMWQISAALALGLLLGVFWASAGRNNRTGTSTLADGAGRSLAALDVSPTNSLLPSWFIIPTACQGDGVDGFVTASRRLSDAPGVQHCCTECHSARPADVRSLDVSRLQLACAFCHRI